MRLVWLFMPLLVSSQTWAQVSTEEAIRRLEHRQRDRHAIAEKSPTTKPTADECRAHLRAALGELSAVQATAESKIKNGRTYQSLRDDVSAAKNREASMVNPTREQREAASNSIARAEERAAQFLGESIARDSAVMKAKREVEERRRELDDCLRMDLLDALGPVPRTHAASGSWKFQGNALLGSTIVPNQEIAIRQCVISRVSLIPCDSADEVGERLVRELRRR